MKKSVITDLLVNQVLRARLAAAAHHRHHHRRHRCAGARSPTAAGGGTAAADLGGRPKPAVGRAGGPRAALSTPWHRSRRETGLPRRALVDWRGAWERVGGRGATPAVSDAVHNVDHDLPRQGRNRCAAPSSCGKRECPTNARNA